MERDPAFAGIVDATGPPMFRTPDEHPFASLVRAITYQQLAGRAAAAIDGRLVASVDGQVVPERVLGLSEAAFRTAGLSGAKTRSILDLASKVADGTVPLGRLGDLADEEIVERLSTVRGIGRWTAEMFLIFQLRRRDVWPVEDFGVRKGYAAIHHLTAAPTPRALRDLGETYRPWRTVAAWYCWRAAETVVPQA